MGLLAFPRRQRLWKPSLAQAKIDRGRGSLGARLIQCVGFIGGAGAPAELVRRRGTILGGNPTWQAGPNGPVMDFDAVGDYAESTETLAQTLPFTFVCRVKVRSYQDFAGVMVIRNASETSLMWRDNASTCRVGSDYQNNQWGTNSGPQVFMNTWTTVAAVFATGGNTWYAVDGTGLRSVFGSQTFTDKSADAPLRLGGSPYDSTGRAMDGQMDWAMWFQGALTADEIQVLATKGLNAVLQQDAPPAWQQPGSAITLPPGQLLAPTSLIGAGSWLKSSDNASTNLYTMVDEVSADDSDFIYSIGTSAATIEFGTYAAFDATGATGYAKVRYRLRRNPLYTAASCTVELVQGTTALVTWTHDTAGSTLPSGLTTYEQTLTAGQMASINQSLPLRLRFTSG